MKKNVNTKSSILNLDANMIIVLCYLGSLIMTWIPVVGYFSWMLPLIIYLVEKENEFIKNQSFQATFFYIIITIISLLFNLIWILSFPQSYFDITDLNNFSGSILIMSIFNILSKLFALLITIISIIAASKTWNYIEYKIPIIGNMASKIRKYMDKFIANNIVKREKIKDKKNIVCKMEDDKNITSKMENNEIKKIKKNENKNN